MNRAEAVERLDLMARTWNRTLTAGDMDELLPRLERTSVGTADAAIGRLGREQPARWPTVWQFEAAVQACRPTAVDVHAVPKADVPGWRSHLADAREALAVARAKSNDPRRVA